MNHAPSQRAYRPAVLVLGFLALGLATPARGQAVPAGSEFPVNTYTTGFQYRPAVSSDAAGNFVVIWEETGQSDDVGVFGQRYSSSGAALGSEFQVNTYTTGRQYSPVLSSDAAANFVVVWSGSGKGEDSGIFGQRYSSGGAALGGEFRVNTSTAHRQYVPAVSSDAAGGFVVVWSSGYCEPCPFGGVFGQRYDSSSAALGSEFRVSPHNPNSVGAPKVSSDAAGNFVVVWRGPLDTGYYGLVGQRFSSSGSALGTEFRVTASSYQRQPAVSSDAEGGFVVVWQDNSQQGPIVGQRYSSSGTALGSEFRVSTYDAGEIANPAVSSDATGGFVVVWHVAGVGFLDVLGRHYSSSGVAFGTEFPVNTYTTDSQQVPAVTSDGAGGFVVVWAGGSQDGSGFGVFGQRFAPRSLPGGGSASQQLTVTDSDRAVELTFQVVAPPIPGGCEVSVEAQPPAGQATTFPMTTDTQVQTISQPQTGGWTITVSSTQGCPDFSYHLIARAVPIVGATRLGLLFMALGAAAVFLLRKRKQGPRAQT